MENLIENTIVAFYIGRGGRFNNAGHLTYLGEKEIGKFTDDLYLRFENEKNFKNRFGFDSTRGDTQRCILDLINDRDFDELKEKFGITEEMLGEEIYTDSNENPVGLTQKEVEEGIGRINIDNDYNTTYTCFLKDCSEKECKLILADRSADDDIKEFIYEMFEDLRPIKEEEEC